MALGVGCQNCELGQAVKALELGATKEEVHQAIGDESSCIINALDPEEFAADVSMTIRRVSVSAQNVDKAGAAQATVVLQFIGDETVV